MSRLEPVGMFFVRPLASEQRFPKRLQPASVRQTKNFARDLCWFDIVSLGMARHGGILVLASWAAVGR